MSTPKSKQKAIEDTDESNESDLEPFPQSYLDELLEKAKAAYKKPIERKEQEEDILTLEKDDSEYNSHPLNEKLNPSHSRFVSQGTSAPARGTETIANAIPGKCRG